jgi:Domain of unknown function (DUF4351)
MMAERDDQDTPWKDMLEEYFPEFMSFFLPDVHAAIDWSRTPAFLDKELQSVAVDAEFGRRYADKLVRVWRIGGDEFWVLIHVEVQGRKEQTFAERMFVYHYRIFDRYRCPILSLAVLSDSNKTWHPETYEHQLWGCKVSFQFPTIKLAMYNNQKEVLRTNTNPFAMVVLAHLAAQATRRSYRSRAKEKFLLWRNLYDLGLSRQQVLGLFRFIDWMLRLPEHLDTQVWQQIQQYGEEGRMTYISSVERRALKTGRELGLEQGRELGLEQGRAEAARQITIQLATKRFGTLTPAIIEQIHALPFALVDDFALAILDFGTIEDLITWLERPPEPIT